MNTTWLTLPTERRIDILNQATEFTGLPVVAIEKRLVGYVGFERLFFFAIQRTHHFQRWNFIEQSVEFD